MYKSNEQIDEIVAPVIAGTVGAATGGKRKVKKSLGAGSGAAVGGALGGPVGAAIGGLAGGVLAGEEAEQEGEQIDEALPAIAAAAGKLAALGSKKAAVGAAGKAAAKKGMMGKVGKAAQSKMGQKAIEKGSEKVGSMVQNKMSSEEIDWDSLDEGKKDACYNKVKARYDVWPSAYASGALVKCRKAGASNWGNKSKKEEFEPMEEGSLSSMVNKGAPKSGLSAMVNKAGSKVGPGMSMVNSKSPGGTGGSASSGGSKMSSGSMKSLMNSYQQVYQQDAEVLEGYKKMPLNKMQDKAAMKPDTAKGEKQARKIAKVAAVGKYAGKEQEEGAKLQNKLNKVNPLKRAFKKPSFDKVKNKAYGLENQRRKDLDKRYGPKKEELEAVFSFLIGEGIAHNEESAINILTHMSDEWYDTIVESFFLNEGMADQNVSGDEAMKRHGIKKHEGPMKVQKLKPRNMRKGEGLGVKGRHAGKNRKGQKAVPVGKGDSGNAIEGGGGNMKK
jgi:hypothetical protein